MQQKQDVFPINPVPGQVGARASPMFILPDCISPGLFGYPDYRFYYSCDTIPESAGNLHRTLYQCPAGMFYNSIYQGCTKPSAFSGRQVLVSLKL